MIGLMVGKEGNMDSKTSVDVVISGKQYTLSGFESVEYLQKVAVYINERTAEFKEKMEGYSRLDNDTKNLLFAINLADDYFRALEQMEKLQEEKTEIEKEIFEMKHRMVEMQAELKALNEDKEKLEQEKLESENKAVRLEAELEAKAGTNPSKDKKHGRR